MNRCITIRNEIITQYMLITCKNETNSTKRKTVTVSEVYMASKEEQHQSLDHISESTPPKNLMLIFL